MKKEFSFIFFGSSPISVEALKELQNNNMLPTAIVTQADSKQGRGLELKPTPVKTWAIENNIKVEIWDKNKDELTNKLSSYNTDVFVLVSFGKILPKSILDIPRKGIVNLHPSLLPKLRGPSPVEYSILCNMKDEIGVSVMLLDEKMDEGPILSQKKIDILDWPISRGKLYEILSKEGARLLSETLPMWMEDKLEPKPQIGEATYSKMIKKEDGKISLADDMYKNFLKFKAYETWPGVYFIKERNGQNIRIKITEANFDNNTFNIIKVIPEGKKEMMYSDFLNGDKQKTQ